MSEEPPAHRLPPALHSTRRSAVPEEIAALLLRRRKLYVLVGALGGVGLALLVVFAARGGSPAPPPESAAKAPPARSKPAPAKPGAKTPADRIRELRAREKETPRAYRALHEAWAALAREAPAELLEEVRGEMDRIQTAATKEYRLVYGPINQQVRELLGARDPLEARRVLQAFQVPAELDVAGHHAEDLRKQLAQVEDLVAFEEMRTKLLAEYKRGEYGSDAATALGPWLGSPQVHVKAEADNALSELKLLRALGLLKARMGSRRAAALARVDEARRRIDVDAAAEKARTSAWEARLRERTGKTPISIRQLGVKDMHDHLRVVKYTGRTVSLASDRMELTLSMDELPADVFGRLILDAPDPTKGEELLEAGKLAVRRNALAAAKALFDRAVKVDRSLSDLVPDLARLAAGIGTLRAQADLQGDTLSIRYDFNHVDQLKDFKVSSNAKALPGPGALALEGERLFYALPGELKFSGRVRIGADPLQLQGSAGYIVGVASETAPGEPDLFIVLVQPDRGYRVVRLHRKGDQEVLGEGSLEGRGGLIEVSVDAGRAELRVGGVTAWTGSLADLAVFQPVIGGAGFQDGAVQVAYRSLKLEGRASPEWIRRLQSERLTILEAELSKERRTTTQELTAGERERDFGDTMLTPLPIESELGDVMPPKIKASYAAGRNYLRKLENAKSEQTILRLWGQVRQTMEDAIREAPWFPLTYFYRAEWRHIEGDTSGAMRDLLEAAANQEGFVEARVARAGLLVHDGKYAEAEKELDASLAIVPDLARARLTRALLHYYAGREAEAVAELELARRLEPGDLFLRRSAKQLRNIVAGPRWSGTVAVDTPHYLIRAESPKLAKRGGKDDSEKAVKDRTQRYADHLDGARAYFAELVSGSESRSRKPLVYICDTPESYYTYADFTAEDRLEHTAGVYFGRYQQLLFFRAETEEETLQTMTHEAFHEYLHAVLPAAPIWLNEGMAEYASGVKIKGGRRTDVGGILHGRLRTLRSALESGWTGFPFEFVVWESKEQFYSLAPELQYAQAWSMIHFFMHGKGGKYKPLLDRYLKVLMETRSTAEARSVFTGADLPAVHREWLSYVKSLR